MSGSRSKLSGGMPETARTSWQDEQEELRGMLRRLREVGGRSAALCLSGLVGLGSLAGCGMGQRVLPPLDGQGGGQAQKPALSSAPVPASASVPAQDGLLPATAVGKVVLSLDEVNRLAGKGLYTSGDPALSAPVEVKGTVKPSECQAVLHALQNKAVAGSAFTGFEFVVFPASDGSSDVFEEGAAVYPDLGPAKTVFRKLSEVAGSCGGKSVDERSAGSDSSVSYRIEVEKAEADVLRWTEHEVGQSEKELCVFEVRMVKNLIFEVVECSSGAGDLATKAANQMAERAV